MALSNTERQRLYRERIKQRLEALAATADPEVIKKLRADLKQTKLELRSHVQQAKDAREARARAQNENLFLRQQVENLEAEIGRLKEEPPPPDPSPRAVLRPVRGGMTLVEQRTFETRRVMVAAMKEMAPDEEVEFLALLRLQIEDLEARKRETGDAALQEPSR